MVFIKNIAYFCYLNIQIQNEYLYINPENICVTYFILNLIFKVNYYLQICNLA